LGFSAFGLRASRFDFFWLFAIIFSFEAVVRNLGLGQDRNANISMSTPHYKGARKMAGLSDRLYCPFVDAIERATEKLHHHRFEK
jgi:hypothetical protein